MPALRTLWWKMFPNKFEMFMLKVEEAQQLILSAMPMLPAETVPTFNASGRILAESICAKVDLPSFDNSAMDGYAVQSADLNTAGPDDPARLRLSGQIPAGKTFGGKIEKGTCARIYTGSPMPEGADAVIMQEDTQPDSADSQFILCQDKVRPWENVRFKGEDIKAGARLADRGARLEAGLLNAIAGTGHRELSVSRRPKVAIIATGSELAEPGTPLIPGQIYESNRVTLSSLAEAAGAETRVYPIASDNLERIQQQLSKGFDECDAIVTSGGVSVGDWDLVRAAFERIGGTIDFWKVAMRPGKPFVFGRYKQKFLFGLPGNPVSAFVTFLILVRPALLQLQRAAITSLIRHPAILAETLFNRGDRRHYVRMTLDDQGNARSSGTQASHILSSLAAANALLALEPGQTLNEGQMVSVLRWQ